MENEIWKDIAGYDGVYQVSNMGRVKSFNKGKERILKQGKSGKKYLQVCLCKDNKHKWIKIHRLVAEAFLENPNNLPCINHKDENPSNNNVQNLEWCDMAYNNSYGSRLERATKSLTNHPKKSKAVLQYSLDGNLIAEFPSTKEVERQFGFDQGGISACCLGKYKQMCGFKWYYKQTENK